MRHTLMKWIRVTLLLIFLKRMIVTSLLIGQEI